MREYRGAPEDTEEELTLAHSFPIPVLLPVTMATLPERSGMLSSVKSDLGGNDWERTPIFEVVGSIV